MHGHLGLHVAGANLLLVILSVALAHANLAHAMPGQARDLPYMSVHIRNDNANKQLSTYWSYSFLRADL